MTTSAMPSLNQLSSCLILLAAASIASAQPIGRLHAKRFRDAGGRIIRPSGAFESSLGSAAGTDGHDTDNRRLAAAAHAPPPSRSPPAPTPTHLAEILAAAAKAKLLVITESLDNGLSEYQVGRGSGWEAS